MPPTPGPLFVAEQLGIDIGMMMISGIIVGGIAAISGMVYAKWINKRKPIPFRDLEEGDDEKSLLPLEGLGSSAPGTLQCSASSPQLTRPKLPMQGSLRAISYCK